ncbi:fimbrial protein [Serratia bockelmannii]|uniref:fimbrial protein n=1 Tax=Serratia TaxID=613 RepID=UPI00235E360D|nr:fimbrial protein [Serratia bockelmannii]
MKRWLYVWMSLFFSLPVLAETYSSLDPFRGKATMSGEVLATGCSIALPDRYQTVSLGEQPIRSLGQSRGAQVKAFHIRLDNCAPSGSVDKRKDIDPAVRIRFDGLRGKNAAWFQPAGSSRGMALVLRDERNEVLYPGEYSQAIFDRSHNQQLLNFTLEWVPDGNPLSAGDYYAALRFNVDYE